MITKKKLKATRFFKPYSETGSCNLKSTGTGVYIIKKNNKVLYVGYSAKDVRKTLYRHFQAWVDMRATYNKMQQPYARITYYNQDRNDFLVKVIYTPTEKEAEILEQLLIQKLKPNDNSLKLELFSRAQNISMLEKLDDSMVISASDTEDPF